MVPAVGRSFQILDLLSRTPAPLGTSEVARRLRLPKSTAHGLLRSLVEVGAGVRRAFRDVQAASRGWAAGAADVRVEKLDGLVARLHAHPRRRLTLLVGVDGPPGSGKTTLACAVARLDPGIELVRMEEFA